MHHRKTSPIPVLEEIASQMDVQGITREELAEKATLQYGHIYGKAITKADLDALFASHHEPKGLTVSILRWTTGLKGMPAPEKWVIKEKSE